MNVRRGGECFTSATDLGTPRDHNLLDEQIWVEGQGKRHCLNRWIRTITDLGVANERAWAGFWRREETKVFHGVDCEPWSVSEYLGCTKSDSRRTIRILAGRGLVASGATPVCAGLPVLGVIGKIIRRVGRRIRLGVDTENGRERDQRRETKTES